VENTAFPILIRRDALEIPETNEWPARITLHKAYKETRKAKANLEGYSPEEALLGALRSGTIRSTRPSTGRIARSTPDSPEIYRYFNDVSVAPAEWATHSAFNPLESSFNLQNGDVVTDVHVFSTDLLRWFLSHGAPEEEHRWVFEHVEDALADSQNRGEFQDKYLYSIDAQNIETRGRRRTFIWELAVSRMFMEYFFGRYGLTLDMSQKEVKTRLRDELDTARHKGGGTADESDMAKLAKKISETVDAYRDRRAAGNEMP
jgi:hypothetical protein